MNLKQRSFIEALGSAALLMIVVGSGLMGQKLSQGNMALTLLANSLATGAGLYALIQTFGPLSGAHFNPVVSFASWMNKELSLSEFLAYISAQIFGAILGVLLTHFIFAESLFQISSQSRNEFPLVISEIIASLGLVLVIRITGQFNKSATAASVALYITAGYWFTSSTSFANPAVTLARSFTNSFTGISFGGVPAFIFAQIIGALLALWVLKFLAQAPA